MQRIASEIDKEIGTGEEQAHPGKTDSCIVHYALVLNIEVEDIPKLVRYLGKLENASIIYQTKSVGKLSIIRE